jgi:hypothetical protein
VHAESAQARPCGSWARISYCPGSGLGGKKNGELLSVTEADFDVLATVDANLRYQQNLARRKIAIVVLQSSSNRLDHLRQYFPACALAIEKVKPGEIVLTGDAT